MIDRNLYCALTSDSWNGVMACVLGIDRGKGKWNVISGDRTWQGAVTGDRIW